MTTVIDRLTTVPPEEAAPIGDVAGRLTEPKPGPITRFLAGLAGRYDTAPKPQIDFFDLAARGIDRVATDVAGSSYHENDPVDTN